MERVKKVRRKEQKRVSPDSYKLPRRVLVDVKKSALIPNATNVSGLGEA